MLNYGKSDLVKVKPTFGGESFELDARLSFKKDAALLHVHLQGGDELSAVVALDELVAYGQSGAEHVPLLGAA